MEMFGSDAAMKLKRLAERTRPWMAYESSDLWYVCSATSPLQKDGSISITRYYPVGLHIIIDLPKVPAEGSTDCIYTFSRLGMIRLYMAPVLVLVRSEDRRRIERVVPGWVEEHLEEGVGFVIHLSEKLELNSQELSIQIDDLPTSSSSGTSFCLKSEAEWDAVKADIEQQIYDRDHNSKP